MLQELQKDARVDRSMQNVSCHSQMEKAFALLVDGAIEKPYAGQPIGLSLCYRYKSNLYADLCFTFYWCTS
jgi:hypothetical protein